MLRRIGLIVIASFAASAMWSCGEEHATQAERIDRPLSKLAARTGPAVAVGHCASGWGSGERGNHSVFARYRRAASRLSVVECDR